MYFKYGFNYLYFNYYMTLLVAALQQCCDRCEQQFLCMKEIHTVIAIK